MDVYEALYTTRAMRRVRPDPVPLDTQARILDAAIRAPSGGNQQNWRFLLVESAEVKTRLGPLYRQAMSQLWETVYADQVATAKAHPERPASIQFEKVARSAQHLADHFEEVPLFLFAFAQHDPTGGSIYPAIWSAMLAARAEGVGSCLTMVLAFRYHEVLEALGVPEEAGWSMAAGVSFGYPLGRWGVAERRPAHEVAFRDRWGQDLGFEVPAPLFRPGDPPTEV